MNKRICIFLIASAFCATLVHAKGKGGAGEHKGWTEGKRVGQSEKKTKCIIGESKKTGKDEERPPGWDKGEKKGWAGDVPPGQEKKQERVKKGAKKKAEKKLTKEDRKRLKKEKKRRKKEQKRFEKERKKREKELRKKQRIKNRKVL